MEHCHVVKSKSQRFQVEHVKQFFLSAQRPLDKRFNSLVLRYKFFMNNSMAVKRDDKYEFDFRFAHASFFRSSW